MSKPTSSKPNPDELLRTNSLTHKEIILRIDYIKELLSSAEVEFDEKQLIKLEKLIEKSRYKQLGIEYDRSKEIPDQIDFFETQTPTQHYKALSEKYLTKKEIESMNKKIKGSLCFDDSDLKLRAPRESVRESDNAKYLKEIVSSKTKIKNNSPQQGFFTLEYPSYDSSVSVFSERRFNQSRITFFKIIVNFVDDKFKITFCNTFKEDNIFKMKPEDHLFPEEIQMAMFEKLISQYPEIEKKLKTAKKIDCIRSNVENSNSLARISRYFEHIKDNPQDTVMAKADLGSSPNQSNTQNFMNQLKIKFGLDLEALPPKTIVNHFAKAINLKQTFTNRRVAGT